MNPLKIEEVLENIRLRQPVFNRGQHLELVISQSETLLIRYNGVNAGFVVFNPEDEEDIYLVLTIHTRTLPKGSRVKLAKLANVWGMKVVFTYAVDIGFGLPTPEYMMRGKQYQVLESIAEISTEEVKTAAMFGYFSPRHSDGGAGILYSYNQKVGEDTIYHAEETLVKFLQITKLHETDQIFWQFWLTELEPCEHCLSSMLNIGAKTIIYRTPHKAKWNTEKYWELVDGIRNKTIKNKNGHPVVYSKSDQLRW